MPTPAQFDAQRLPLKIGSRGSKLALIQAETVAAAIVVAHGLSRDAVRIEVIRTSGDQIQDRPLRDVGGKGLFTKEIDDALLAGSIDLAVHSMKDVETRLPDGMAIDCMLKRDDVRDAYISRVAPSLAELPAGALIGTSSLRRQAQVLRMRPDLKVVTFRGNVETRLAKLESGIVHATMLSAAGLTRTQLLHVATALLETETMLPAVAQGVIGIARRSDDVGVAALLAPLNDADTTLCVTAERAMLARLDGSCHTPIAGLAVPYGSGIRLRGEVLLPDGGAAHAVDLTTADNSLAAVTALGERAAEQLLAAAGPAFLAAIAVAGRAQ